MPASRISVLTALLALVAGALAEAQAAKRESAGEMTFTILDTSGICNDCSVIQASGSIAPGTASSFRGFIDREKLRQNVYFILESSGGDMKNGLELGLILRETNAKTVVGRAVVRDGEVEIEPGECFSACVLAFLGGTARTIPKDSTIAVHSWRPAEAAEQGGGTTPKPLDQASVEHIHRQTAAYLYFLEYLGIDLRLAIRTLDTPHESLSPIDPYEQRLWKVTTTDSTIAAPLDRDVPILLLQQSVPPLLTRGPKSKPVVSDENPARSVLHSEGR